jgi:hypothetical protein
MVGGSAKIETIYYHYFFIKMFKVIDALNMKEGEIYFIIKYNYIQEVIFINYQIPKNDKPFAVFSYSDCPTYFAWFLNNSVYQYISKEKYKAMLKENYNVKCLDIVFTRLVDKLFQW